MNDGIHIFPFYEMEKCFITMFHSIFPFSIFSFHFPFFSFSHISEKSHVSAFSVLFAKFSHTVEGQVVALPRGVPIPRSYFRGCRLIGNKFARDLSPRAQRAQI